MKMRAVSRPDGAVVASALVTLFAGPAAAVSEGDFPWMLSPMGARASGMGGANVTEAAGADRLYWNPALLGVQDGVSGTGMFYQPYSGLGDENRFWYLAAAGGWERVGGFGANVMRLSFGDSGFLPGVVEWSASVGYGVALSDRVSGGIAAKIIRSELAGLITGESVTAWAVDLGVHARDLFGSARSGAVLPNGFRWALVIQNFGPHVRIVDDGAEIPLPLNFRMGIGCEAFEDERHRVTLAAEMGKVLVRQTGDGLAFEVDPPWAALVTAWSDGSLREELEETVYNLGAEYAFRETLFLRTGWVYDKFDDIRDATLGVGLGHRGFRIDYAAYPQGADRDREHRVSLTYDGIPSGTR